MAKSKKTSKAKKVSRKSVLHRQVDNKLSILLIVAAIFIFVLAALSMGK